MFSHIKELFTRPSGYSIAKSVRLRSSASAYFNRTPASASNRKTWTWSAWVKRGLLATDSMLFSAANGSARDYICFYGGAQLTLDLRDAFDGQKTTTQLFRDPSAWYHIVVAVDTTQATANNRISIYVNGVQVTAFANNSAPSQNYDGSVNNTVLHTIGKAASAGSAYLDGYITEINFIDGQALTPSSFGETDSITGVWKAKKYSGTYGTNGFYLNFSDNSSNTATTIGKDYSGNGNNWTPNNISVTSGVTYDSMTDVPTLTSATAANYCVGNPLDNSGTLSSGNLTFVSGGSNQSNRATFQLLSSGKFYAECTLGTTTSASVGEAFGYATASASLTGTPNSSGKYVIYADSTGAIYSNGSTLISSLGTFASGTVLQIAYDGTTGNAWVGKNNTWYNSSGGTTGDPSAGSNPTFTSLTSVFPFTQGVNGTQNLNFGQRPFSYTPPTGFVALNTYNLPASTITNGAAYMAATTYTGTGSAQNITNSGSFQPDFVWIKNRGGAYGHGLVDSVRGRASVLYSNDTAAQGTSGSTQDVTAFNSNGFALGTNSQIECNASGQSYIGWQWKAGGSSSSNTNGSITSTVSAGATQGFSVVTWTPPASAFSNLTVGHGLGVSPKLVITKCRTSAGTSWLVWHGDIGTTQYLILNTTNAVATNSAVYNGVSSTTFTIGNDSIWNGGQVAGVNYVSYCFAAVAGYSAFGSYTGNGSTDGTFVYTGFRPRWVMIKASSGSGSPSTQSWYVLDSSRDTYNLTGYKLFPNSSNAENSGQTFDNNSLDFLSNGFKLRTSNDGTNNSLNTYIYACFAENPFRNALAR